MNTCRVQVPAGSTNSYGSTIRAFETDHPFKQEILIRIKMGRDGRKASKFDLKKWLETLVGLKMCPHNFIKHLEVLRTVPGTMRNVESYVLSLILEIQMPPGPFLIALGNTCTQPRLVSF